MAHPKSRSTNTLGWFYLTSTSFMLIQILEADNIKILNRINNERLLERIIQWIFFWRVVCIAVRIISPPQLQVVWVKILLESHLQSIYIIYKISCHLSRIPQRFKYKNCVISSKPSLFTSSNSGLAPLRFNYNGTISLQRVFLSVDKSDVTEYNHSAERTFTAPL